VYGLLQPVNSESPAETVFAQNLSAVWSGMSVDESLAAGHEMTDAVSGDRSAVEHRAGKDRPTDGRPSHPALDVAQLSISNADNQLGCIGRNHSPSVLYVGHIDQCTHDK